MDRGLLLHDADCGFCMRTARQVPRLGLPIDQASIQEVDLAAHGVDAERAVREMPYIHPDGRVVYGHAAWAAALRTGRLPWRLVGRVITSRPIDPLAIRVYRWVSEHRHQLPGGTPACALDQRP